MHRAVYFCASIFHQKLLTIRELKEYLNENGVEMRL